MSLGSHVQLKKHVSASKNGIMPLVCCCLCQELLEHEVACATVLQLKPLYMYVAAIQLPARCYLLTHPDYERSKDARTFIFLMDAYMRADNESAFTQQDCEKRPLM
jgi:hypothetical protein